MDGLQPSLFAEALPEVPHFDGATFEPEQDGARLASQLHAVRDLMLYGAPLTIAQIRARLFSQGIRATEASISARIRDLRKIRFGGYIVERTRLERGLFAYRLVTL